MPLDHADGEVLYGQGAGAWVGESASAWAIAPRMAPPWVTAITSAVRETLGEALDGAADAGADIRKALAARRGLVGRHRPEGVGGLLEQRRELVVA